MINYKEKEKTTNVFWQHYCFYPDKMEKINGRLTWAKARFFGFAKIVTERVFFNYQLSVINNDDKKNDDTTNVGVFFHE